MNENLGIMRLRFVRMRAIGAFVTDLDTRPLFWLLFWLPVVLAWLPVVLVRLPVSLV